MEPPWNVVRCLTWEKPNSWYDINFNGNRGVVCPAVAKAAKSWTAYTLGKIMLPYTVYSSKGQEAQMLEQEIIDQQQW